VDLTRLDPDLLHSEEACHLIGYLMGRHVGTLVPVVRGLPETTHKDSLKGMAAAGGASGGVAMFQSA